MGITPSVGRDGGGGIVGGGDLCLPLSEQICTVYYDQSHYGTLYGGRAEAKVKGGQEVVGSGRTGFGRDMDGGSGGGINGVGGGER